MWMRVITVLAVLPSDLLAMRTRHYVSSPFGSWKAYDADIHVQTTDNGRIEVMEKILTKRELDGGFFSEKVRKEAEKLRDVNNTVEAFKDLTRQRPEAGKFNVISMNPSTEEIWNSEVIDPVFEYLFDNEDEQLFFVVMMMYDGLSKRPYGLGVFVTIGVKMSEHLVKGYVPNPMEPGVNGVVPYLCSMGRERTLRIRNTLYSTMEIGRSKEKRWTVRVEKAEKTVDFGSLNTGTAIDEVNREHALKLSKNDGDVPGQLIPWKLGGEGGDPYNVVPMSQKAFDAFKTQIEKPISAFFCEPSNRDESVVLTVFVVYDSNVSTRPSGFIALSRGSNSDFKIFIPN